MIVKLPAVLESERAIEGSLIAVVLAQVGASFTALTLIVALLLAVENALLPPVVSVLTLLPAAPLL